MKSDLEQVNKDMVLVRKMVTAIKIIKENGINGIINALRKKYYFYVQIKRLKKIAEASVFHLSYTSLAIERGKTLAEGINYIISNAVEGDVAEFGTMHANTAVALAASLGYVGKQMHGSELALGFTGKRKLWLFDSFEGFPEATLAVDKTAPLVASGLWGKGKAYGYSPELLKKLVANYLDDDQINIKKGWYKDTVPLIPVNTKFGLIHIDCDLYESTMDVLDNLFRMKMISKGALICFDDWYCNASDPDMGEQKVWRDLVIKYNINFTDVGSYGAACHRFVVNSYNN